MLDRRLTYFVAIADQGGFRRASETLGITQPALTKAIRSLEGELGTALFERHAGGVTLTQAGQLLVRRARGMLAESRSARIEIAAAVAGATELLRIGAGAGWASQVLPRVVARLRQEQPNIRIEIRIGSTSEIHAAIEAGDLDVGFGAMEPLRDVPAIREYPLATVRNVLFVRPGHPLARHDGLIEIADAFAYPWIMLRPDDLMRREIAARMAGRDLPPFAPTVECSSVIACMNLAVLDDSVLCLSELLAVEASRHGLTMLPVPLASFSLGAWHRSVVSAAKQELIQALISLAQLASA